jgi:predicted MFS family arabinose efflux permease
VARSIQTARADARGVWLGIFAVAFGTNVPTPLLLSYRGLLDLSATMLTVVFAVYAVGLVPALLLAGPASDRRGRRPIVLPFVVLAGVASVILMAASVSLPALLAGRLLQGAVSGVVFSVGSAWLTEVVGDAAVASRRAVAAMSLGFSLGPLMSGLLAQWAPWPTVLPYLVHLALVAGALVLVPRVPETVTRRRGRAPRLNLGVPRPARPAFLAFVVPVALCVFAFPSVSITLLPLGLQTAMPGIELVVTGLVAGVTLGVGVLVQPLEKRLGTVRAAPVAAVGGASGLALGVVALYADMPWLLLPVAVLLGTGYGLGLASGLTATQWLADPEQRGALVATFYALTYLGFGAPVVLSALSDGTAFAVPLAGLALLAATAGVWLAVGPGGRMVASRRDRTRARAVGSPPRPSS